MKALFIVLLGFGVQAYAQDQGYTVESCHLAAALVDAGISAKVTTGTLIGVSSLDVTQSFLGKSSTKTYFVKETTKGKGSAEEVIYTGPGVKLTINFGKGILADGGFSSTLVINDETGKMVQDMSCQSLAVPQ